MVVVLAIIGILVAIQLPNIIGNTDKAKLIAAQATSSSAITECATAKTNGATEDELYYSNPSFVDLVPSMFANPSGYKWSNESWKGCEKWFSLQSIRKTILSGRKAFLTLWQSLHQVAKYSKQYKAADQRAQ